MVFQTKKYDIPDFTQCGQYGSVLSKSDIGRVSTSYALAPRSQACHLIRTCVDMTFRQKRKKLPLPPGPRGLPFVGNFFDLPKAFEAVHWAKHKNLYGPLSSISIFGTTVIIINDSALAIELLEKRSTISSRPFLTFAESMVGFRGTTTLLPNGPLLRLHRKEILRYIGSPSVVREHHSLIEAESSRFLFQLLERPSNLIQHIRTTAGAIILKLSHGYNVDPHNSDPFVELSDRVLDIFSHTHIPGAYLVDTFPFLRFLPDWFPGTKFKKEAKLFSEEIDRLLNKPFAFVKQQMRCGLARPSLALSLIERNVADDYNKKWIASTMYAAGADTTVSALSTFFLAMVLYPDVLAKAQNEIDSFVGRDRVPRIADRASLPYVNAIVKETLRWNNVLPTSIPRAIDEDEIYMGYRLPKGAIVLTNLWLMLHDPSVYPEPFVFKPDRFLGSCPQPDPRAIVFGHGKRICPGKVLADSSLFSSIVKSIATFNIRPARDENGREIIPVNECTRGVVSYPKPFKYEITPRDERATALVRSVLVEYPFEESDAAVLEKF